MPFYLKSIGFSIVLIGVLEGMAEAVAGLSKGYFGKWSDETKRRMPFVRLGYGLSAISKPMMVVFLYPIWIFFARTIDRFGKGLRTGARDAILSDEATEGNKGRVFGLHRAMDTFGAVLGPLIALLYLVNFPGDYKTLFIIAFFPGIAAVACTYFITEKREKKIVASAPKLSSFFSYWKESPEMYKKVAGALLIFMLFNSSDVFLLLKAKQAGLSDSSVIMVYIFYNLIYALASLPAGIIGDKIGLKKMLVTGLIFFAITYAGMSIAKDVITVFILFFVYGIYAACTEGVSKALLSNVVARKDVATALGTFSGFQSISLLLASSVTGLIWYKIGPEYALINSALVSLGVGLYFLFISLKKNPLEHDEK
jgi:MFS family permease